MAHKNQQEHESLMNPYMDIHDRFQEPLISSKLKALHREAELGSLEHICFVNLHLRPCHKTG